MLMKIRRDMPLPMPRAVISSPSHMTAVVPAVSVMMMSSACSRSQIRAGACSVRNRKMKPIDVTKARATVS